VVSDTLLWYTTRGAGAVSLVLLTGVVVLAIRPSAESTLRRSSA
jgi:hypothetical protein